MGGTERPYDKNQRILQVVKGAWADAEARLHGRGPREGIYFLDSPNA